MACVTGWIRNHAATETSHLRGFCLSVNNLVTVCSERTHMKSHAGSFLFCAHILFTTSSALANVPPEYVEPTRAQMKSLGLKFAIDRNNAISSIDWHFPKHVLNREFSLVPHTTNIIVKDLSGNVIARATNGISGSPIMSFDTSYNHKVTDVSISVTYACGRSSKKGCYGATTLSIPSVSKFILANPDALNLRPKCQKVTEMIVDCRKYQSDEHP